jgi:hypothetical protein
MWLRISASTTQAQHHLESVLSKNKAAVLAAAERRRKARCRVTVQGLIYFPASAKPLECTIRDLSNTGARIALRTKQLVPREVYLINMRDRLAYRADVEWRTSIEMGLVFRETYSLAALTDPKLMPLKTLWHRRVSA